MCWMKERTYFATPGVDYRPDVLRTYPLSLCVSVRVVNIRKTKTA